MFSALADLDDSSCESDDSNQNEAESEKNKKGAISTDDVSNRKTKREHSSVTIIEDDEDDFNQVSLPTPLSKRQRKNLRKKLRKQERRGLSILNTTDEHDPKTKSLRMSMRVRNILKAPHKTLKGLGGRISEAFERGNWEDALCLLVAMERHNKDIGKHHSVNNDVNSAIMPKKRQEQTITPKLGAIQRWVASLGDGASEDKVALGLLNAILRVSDGLGGLKVSCTFSSDGDRCRGKIEDKSKTHNDNSDIVRWEGNLCTLEDWSAIPLMKNNGEKANDRSHKNLDMVDYSSTFPLLITILGDERTPPNRHDLSIYEHVPRLPEDADGSNATQCISLKNEKEKKVKVGSVQVPFAPGAFMLTNLLSKEECQQFIHLSESIGYVPDEPKYRDVSTLVAATPAGLNDRAANFTLLADDESLLSPLIARCRHLLPSNLPDGSALCGLNARWRMYRYRPGSVYRPHVDGAWPPSGKDKVTGDYLYDISNGTQRSRYTFLIYLNEGFVGGTTTFFTPSMHDERTVEARGVSPRCGCALVFPHGEGIGSLVHEGSALLEGTKYIIRTDVVYTIPSKSSNSRGRHQKK